METAEPQDRTSSNPNPAGRFPIQENDEDEPFEEVEGGVLACNEGIPENRPLEEKAEDVSDAKLDEWEFVEPISDSRQESSFPHPAHLNVSLPSVETISGPCQEVANLPQHEANPAVALPQVTPKVPVNPLPPPRIHIIAHSKKVQALFDMVPLSWGVQYELARGVSQSTWSWKTVLRSKSALKSLSGPNASASRVSEVLDCPLEDPPQADDAVWSELDREDAAIAEGHGRGLGLQGDFMGEQNWYGGKVQQSAVLREEGKGFRIVLAKMEMGKSNRFARFLGSRRMLQVSIPHNILNARTDELREFFGHKFVLCGRVFVAFCVQGAKVFLMETPEDYDRAAGAPGDDQRIPLMDFVAWHSPMELNSSQPIPEWASSFELGLSSSVPVLSIPPDNVHHIDDQVAPLNDPDKAPPAECIHTDGCGWINTAALGAIARHMGLEERPTAVQGHFGGATGLWVMHPDNHSSTPEIWIRDSQIKIKLDVKNPHPAHNIFELLGMSRVTPGRLSRPVIMNLAHNGVPKETLVELMEDMVDQQVKPLMGWSGPQAMLWLSTVVESLKASRDCQWPDDDWQLPGPAAHTRRTRTIHDVVLDLLQAGFHPIKLEFLFDSLRKVVRLTMDSMIRDFRISVYRSARAFIIPDPYGVLREGEIHFKSTKLLHDPEDLDQYLLLGDVLIYRDRCMLPSDVQKVKAVRCEALSTYTDVIVVPVTGPRSFASYLGGGHYDGDVANVIYDDRLVKDFRTPPLALEPRRFVNKNFDKSDVIQQATVGQLAADSQYVEMSLLSNLQGTVPLGLYCRFHKGSMYERGYDAPETIRLAFMLKRLLESQKTGRCIKERVLNKDRAQFNKRLPPSLQTASDGPQPWMDLPVCFKRDPALGQFILDSLFDAGWAMQEEQFKRYDGMRPRVFERDVDLLQPWEKARPWLADSSPVAADLALIQEHVDAHIKKWQTIAQRTSSNRFTRKGPAARNAAEKSTQAQYDELTQSYASGPEISPESLLASVANIEQLKASYAFTQKPKFAWTIALQTLCQTKNARWRVETVVDTPAA